MYIVCTYVMYSCINTIVATSTSSSTTVRRTNIVYSTTLRTMYYTFTTYSIAINSSISVACSRLL